MKIVLIGPPLSGKGTLAKYLLAHAGLVHISTGDLFRDAIKKELPVGMEAKGYMDRGELVPDALTIKILKERLQANDLKKGFILDGFPRTIGQAEELDKILKPDIVVYLDLGEELLLKRLMGRISCSNCGTPYHLVTSKPKVEGICDHCGSPLTQRKDDSVETFAVRLATYQKGIAPVIEFYQKQNILKKFDAAIGTVEIFKAIIGEIR